MASCCCLKVIAPITQITAGFPCLPDLFVEYLIADLDVLGHVPRQVDHGNNAVYSCTKGWAGMEGWKDGRDGDELNKGYLHSEDSFGSGFEVS